MNWAHVHLILNHIPPIGAVFGLALLIYGVYKDSDDVKRAALWAFVILAVITIPVYLTGEEADPMVEHMAGISDPIIDRHSDSAGISMTGMELLGLLSLVGVIAGWAKSKKWFISLSLVLSVVVVTLMSWTAYLGGQIHHPEARYGLAAPPESVTHAEKD